MTLRLAALLAVLGVVGCADGERPLLATLTVGVLVDSTTPSAYRTWATSANLAISDANEGLRRATSGMRFSLQFADTQHDSALALARGLELVRQRGARALLTDTTENAVALASLMYDDDPGNDLGVPIVCVACTTPQLNDPTTPGSDPSSVALRDPDNWIFRTCPGADQLTVLARLIAGRGDSNGDGKVKVSAVVLDERSGHGFARAARAALPASTALETVAIPGLSLEPSQVDAWNVIVGRLNDDGSDCPQDPAGDDCLPEQPGDGRPDTMIAEITPSNEIALTRAAAQVSTPPILHGAAFRSLQVPASLGQLIDGQRGLSPLLHADSDSGQRFAGELAARGQPLAVYDAGVYDAVVALSLATVKASRNHLDVHSTTGAEVRAALGLISDGEHIGSGPVELGRAFDLMVDDRAIDYDGASGPLDFDRQGNVRADLTLYQGEGDRLVDRRTFGCARDPACP